MERFSIPSIDTDLGSESLAEVFVPQATRVIPRIEVEVRPRGGSGVSLVAREHKRRRTAIAATAASLACVGTLLALYVI